MVFCARKFRGVFKKEHKYIVCRKMRKFNQAEFLMDVTNVPWETIVRSFETVEETVHLFTETLNLIIEKHAPLQQRRVSQKYCPWLTPDFYKLRKSRDKLKKSAIKTKSRILMESYRHVRNKVNSLNRTLKKKYYSNKIQESVGNLQQTWKIANQIVDKSSKTTKIDSIRLDDKTINDKKIIPNIMNEYFCNIGNSLKESVPYEKNPLM